MSATVERVCDHAPSDNPRYPGTCRKCGRPIQPELGVGDRQPDLEREFLRGAERIAGLEIGWAESVEDRLLRMERAKGHDSYKKLGLRKLLAEIEEEALDLGGWPVLAALVTYEELDGDVAHEARLLLQEIAAHGVRVSGLIERLRELTTE